MDLKSGEKISTRSNYRPEEAVSEGITARELLRIVTKKKGEEINTFIPPISLKERLLLEAYKLLDDLTEFGDVMIPLKTTHIPLKWALILEFLRKQGIVLDSKSPFFWKMQNDAPKRFAVKLYLNSIEGMTDGTILRNGVSGHALAEDAELAASKAMGEFLERLFLVLYRKKNLVFSNTDILKKKHKNFLDPVLVQHFTEAQQLFFPKKCAVPQGKEFGWVESVSLIDNKPILIPAQLIYWNYNRQYDGQEEPMLMEQNTNGGAGQFSRDKAILSGLRELIERDAFLIHWLKKIPPRRIALDSIKDEKIQKLLQEFSQYQYQVELCDVTLDMGEHVIIPVILDKSRLGPMLVVSGACHENIIMAIHKALLEALTCCQGQRRFGTEKSLKQNYQPFFDDTIGQNERSALADNPKNFDQYAWFITGELYALNTEDNKIKCIPDEDALKKLLQVFKEKNENVYYYEVKDRVLDKLNYHIVKVIAPFLMPLYLMETNAPLNHPRLNANFPRALSQKKVPDGVYGTPHPFP